MCYLFSFIKRRNIYILLCVEIKCINMYVIYIYIFIYGLNFFIRGTFFVHQISAYEATLLCITITILYYAMC